VVDGEPAVAAWIGGRPRRMTVWEAVRRRHGARGGVIGAGPRLEEAGTGEVIAVDGATGVGFSSLMTSLGGGAREHG
jgi:hypothetical protein